MRSLSRSVLFCFVSVSLLVSACSGGDPAADETAQSSDDALKVKAPRCNKESDCVSAIEDGSWKLSSRTLDECIQNHDFVYICTACESHVCKFHPGF